MTAAVPSSTLAGDAADASLAREVSRLLGSLPQQRLPVLLVVPFEVTPRELEELLALSAVGGCLVNESGAKPGDPCTGFIRHTGEWTFPAVAARSVCFLGWSRMIRPRRLFEAMRRGMPWVTALDARGRWKTQRVPAWYLGFLRSRWNRFQVMRQMEKAKTKLIWCPRARRAAMKAIAGLRSLPDLGFDPGRVMQVTGSLGAGGAERQLLNTAIGLAGSGYRPDVLCFECGHRTLDFHLAHLSEHARVYTFNNLSETLVRAGDTRFEDALLRMQDPRITAFIRSIPLVLREPVLITTLAFMLLRPGVVHLWQDATNVIGGLAALIAGVPRIILSGRNVAPYHFFYYERYMRPLYRLLLDYPEVSLVNNSHAGAASYADWLGVDERRITVIHNGLDTATFRAPEGSRDELRAAWRIRPGALVIGGVFRFSPEKDPMLWLETAARIRGQLPACRFVLFGEGALQAQIEATARELGLADALLLPGVTRDIPAALAAFDLLLLTSTQEGLPNVLMEAQALGCPVVTTDAGGAAETLVDGVTGWVVRERSAQALADRCCQALGDTAWRREAAEAGPRHIEQVFGMSRMLAETMQLYPRPGRH